MKIAVLISAGLLALASSATLLAGDIEAGKTKSAVCAACHGPAGISPMDLWPNLAGQKEGYLAQQLKAFREGTRTEPTMSPMAANLSDEDIADLAAYYSSLK